MTSEVGICPATLLVEPLRATEADQRAAGEAAIQAGFTQASVWAFQLAGFAACGLRTTVLEAATAWAGDDPAEAAREVEHFAGLVEQCGAPLVAAVTMAPAIRDRAAARRNLGALAARLAPLGARVCVEFFAWSALANLRLAWELIEPVEPAVGLVLDTFHWVRQVGGPDHDLLGSIPGDRISYVQLADATPEPRMSPEAEGMGGRLLPGQGIVEFDRLLGVLSNIGAEPFFATEVFSPELITELGAVQAAVAMRDAGRSIIG